MGKIPEENRRTIQRGNEGNGKGDEEEEEGEEVDGLEGGQMILMGETEGGRMVGRSK